MTSPKITFRREPCSAEEMVVLRARVDRRALGRRGLRLLLLWWGGGIEEQTRHECAPYVCPGCHAVGGERCAPGCIDDEMRNEREREYEELDDD
jgi:hypothetical protein